MKRIGRIVRKEFIQIRRDKGMMRMLVLGPLLQLLIYGYVVATDIRALPMAVLDQAGSAESRRLVDRFTSSGYFTLETHVNSLKEAERRLNDGSSMIVLVIPEDYDRNIHRGVLASCSCLWTARIRIRRRSRSPTRAGLLLSQVSRRRRTISVAKACGFSKPEFEKSRGSGSIRHFGRSTTWFRVSFASF